MPPRREKSTVEKAARALCHFRDLPEDTRYQGGPMWHSHLLEALQVLKAALPPEDFRRLVLDQPWPGPPPGPSDRV